MGANWWPPRRTVAAAGVSCGGQRVWPNVLGRRRRATSCSEQPAKRGGYWLLQPAATRAARYRARCRAVAAVERAPAKPVARAGRRRRRLGHLPWAWGWPVAHTHSGRKRAMLARARAFVYYFNTERNAVYCVLYVFLFFIVEP